MAESPLPRFFMLLMAVATILLALVLKPVASELILAAVFAGVLWPVQGWLCKRLGNRPSLAAALLTVAVVLLLLGPIAMMVTFVVRDGADGVKFVTDALHSKEVAALIDRLPSSARDAVNSGIDRMPSSLGELAGQVNPAAGAQAASAALAATGSLAFSIVLMLIAMFFMLVSGRELVHWLDEVSPLREGRTRELLSTFRRVSYAVVVSTGVTAAVQAIAALVGYLIAGVPSPAFFALVTFFLAFVPAIGAAVVCLFAAALLLVTGHLYMAIFLAVWGLAVVGLVDNLVKPLVIRRGLEIHGAVVFFSLIGGLAAFGAIGLVLGPLMVAFFLAVLRIYHQDYTPDDTRVPEVPGIAADEPTPDAAPPEPAT